MRSASFQGSEQLPTPWHENCLLRSGLRNLAPVEFCDG
ncbi:hypothetical protein RB549 [Rhodopirellula baltica SH 1]|uniref:Uncharacterized protein n=1 Tax=Rhodopirellula baltica (strain DSM 10527 / NCIMB 13988 / SH1) TaxID=243090 RepID=Q7UYJ6_RHOBA|nr:hypothetical protein RB549 [Rhodopirellula baltica SH 1]